LEGSPGYVPGFLGQFRRGLTYSSLPQAATDDSEFELLGKWLESYHPGHLFNTDIKNDQTKAHNVGATAEGVINEKALRIIPKDQKRRMGMVDVSTFRSGNTRH
jgi:hypothetical protein